MCDTSFIRWADDHQCWVIASQLTNAVHVVYSESLSIQIQQFRPRPLASLRKFHSFMTRHQIL